MSPNRPPVLPHQAATQAGRLGRHLVRSAVSAAGVALVVAGAMLNLALYGMQRSALVDDTRVQAQVTADALAPALLFDDRRAGHETLEPLQGWPALVAAAVDDAAGHRFASYHRTDAGTQAVEALARPSWRHEQVAVPVQHDGRELGRLHLAVSLDGLHRRSAWFALITALAALAALGMAYLRTLRVRGAIDRTEARLDELAFVDPVTRLYNRHAANEHLAARCVGVPGAAPFTLAVLDLDDFKVINDTLGHAAGDRVLGEMGERLRAGVGEAGTAYRHGGDEFIVLLERVADEAAAAHAGEALLALLRSPLSLEGQAMYLRGSVGLARYPQDAATQADLLAAADAAMYAAKKSGKNHFALYRPEMRQPERSRLHIEVQLRAALARGELRLHYQPIVNLASGRTVGAEALVRWQHPERGLLPPSEFIDVAEASDLIVDIGAWVIDEAARQLAAWRALGLARIFVAVNASARQVTRGALERQVTSALERHRLAPGMLEVEITESLLLADAECNVRALQALRQRGVRVAVDDFGTGQSSLAYLKRLPVDKFKIDRSFVHELPHARGDVAIITAVITMARTLGLRVVAEGVEREDQRDLLRALGCDDAQGWLLGRPVTANALAESLGADHVPPNLDRAAAGAGMTWGD